MIISMSTITINLPFTFNLIDSFLQCEWSRQNGDPADPVYSLWVSDFLYEQGKQSGLRPVRVHHCESVLCLRIQRNQHLRFFLFEKKERVSLLHYSYFGNLFGLVFLIIEALLFSIFFNLKLNDILVVKIILYLSKSNISAWVSMMKHCLI